MLSSLFKTYVRSSIGTPNSCSSICQQSITTPKEYVGSSHVSISVYPAGDCPTPHMLSNRSRTPQHSSCVHFQIVNEIVIWDRIVRRREDATIHIDNGSNKYAFREISKSFRCADCFGLSPSSLEIWVPDNSILVEPSPGHHPNLLSSSKSERSFTGMPQKSNLYSSTT